jgi:hypothetical protein
MMPSLTGQSVSSVTYVGALYVDTEEGWQITIESDFTVHHSGDAWSKSGGELDEIVARLSRCVGERITQFEIGATGTLEFLVGPYAVHAAPSPKYEAWNVAGPDKQLVVCTPGGELAIWD